MKDELYDALFGHGVKYLEVRENIIKNGLGVDNVKVYSTFRTDAYEFDFPTGTPVDEMADHITSFLRNRT